MKTQDFVVRLDVPNGATIKDVTLFIHEAVVCHVGSLHREDPMNGLNKYCVHVFGRRK